MTIAYPRAMPETGASGISFEPRTVDYMSPETGGRIGAVAAGFTLWRMRINLTAMDEVDADIWRAFIASLRGSRRAFVAHDLNRQRPRLHRDGPFSAVAADWSQEINDAGDALLSLEGLLPGMTLSIGDYVGFRWDDADDVPGNLKRLALVRVQERGTADASGDLTVIVEPPVPSVVPSGAEAYFRKAGCLMRATSAEPGMQVPGGYTADGGSIEAVQDLRP